MEGELLDRIGIVSDRLWVFYKHCLSKRKPRVSHFPPVSVFWQIPLPAHDFQSTPDWADAGCVRRAGPSGMLRPRGSSNHYPVGFVQIEIQGLEQIGNSRSGLFHPICEE